MAKLYENVGKTRLKTRKSLRTNSNECGCKTKDQGVTLNTRR